jgi:hypothetical protein
MPLSTCRVVDAGFAFFASYEIEKHCRRSCHSQERVVVASAMEILEVQPTRIKDEKKDHRLDPDK